MEFGHRKGMQEMNYEFAKSLSGHDRDQIYLIVAREGRFAFLADGKAHTAAHPKKKNEKHFQVIKNIPDEIQMRLEENKAPADDIIRWAVRTYQRSINK